MTRRADRIVALALAAILALVLLDDLVARQTGQEPLLWGSCVTRGMRTVVAQR